jgi:hypothetical protein
VVQLGRQGPLAAHQPSPVAARVGHHAVAVNFFLRGHRPTPGTPRDRRCRQRRVTAISAARLDLASSRSNSRGYARALMPLGLVEGALDQDYTGRVRYTVHVYLPRTALLLASELQAQSRPGAPA